jgi:succinate dehydrogenase / fumarate reductase membrane anchor subunit
VSVDFRTPLARVRGLGSAKEGVSHWWWQRMTAIALVPLCIWMVCFVIGLLGADYLAVRASVAQPLNGGLLMAFVVCLFYHGQLGLQVVIEDYIHHRPLEIFLQIAVKFSAYLLAGASVLAVLRIMLGS